MDKVFLKVAAGMMAASGVSTQAWAHCAPSGCASAEILGTIPSLQPVLPPAAPIASHTVSLPTTTTTAPLTLAPGSPFVTNQTGAGLNIVVNAGAGLVANPEALAAFNRAAAQFEAVIADPITVTIDADLGSLGDGILGSASTPLLNVGFDTLRDALVADAADEADDAIVAFLPTASQFAADVPVGFGLSGLLGASPANLRALGFDDAEVDAVLAGAGITADSTITLNTDFDFDFDNSDGITFGTFDFESVALHEIGHALGFLSEVDGVDQDLEDGVINLAVTPLLLDLFRFEDGSDNDPETAEEFTDAIRSLLPGSDDVLDQVLAEFGLTEIPFETGAFNGSGFQASHFEEFLGLGVLDPAFLPGEVVTLSANDLRALDLIGFEIVPEPGVATGLLAVSGLLAGRRRRSA